MSGASSTCRDRAGELAGSLLALSMPTKDDDFPYTANV